MRWVPRMRLAAALRAARGAGVQQKASAPSQLHSWGGNSRTPNAVSRSSFGVGGGPKARVDCVLGPKPGEKAAVPKVIGLGRKVRGQVCISLGRTFDASWKLTGEAGLEAGIWGAASSLCPLPPGEVYQRLQCSRSDDTGVLLETTATAMSRPSHQGIFHVTHSSQIINSRSVLAAKACSVVS